MEKEGEDRSESGRPYGSGSELSQDVAKLIQSEIAKCFSQFAQKSQGGGTSTDVNMVQGGKDKQTPFEGHYAFSVVPSITRQRWIIDSGASSHVCHDANLMISIDKLADPVDIHLLDGTIKTVRYAGDARINKNIFLRDVLMIPGFTHNLISVAQLFKIQEQSVLFIQLIVLSKDMILARS